METEASWWCHARKLFLPPQFKHPELLSSWTRWSLGCTDGFLWFSRGQMPKLSLTPSDPELSGFLPDVLVFSTSGLVVRKRNLQAQRWRSPETNEKLWTCSSLGGHPSNTNRELEVPDVPTCSAGGNKPARPADMDFSGTWKVYSEENLDEFLQVVGEKMIRCVQQWSLCVCRRVWSEMYRQELRRWLWRCVKTWSRWWWSSRAGRTSGSRWRLRSSAGSTPSPSAERLKSAAWTAGSWRWLKLYE